MNRYSMSVFVLFYGLVCVCRISRAADYVQFYNDDVDFIENINADDFAAIVVDSERITLIKMYANWCVYSKGFVPHYKQFAKDTRLWHKNVLRVTAMDCSLTRNKKLCQQNNVKIFPSFLFYQARSDQLVGHMSETIYSRTENFMRTVIDMLENQTSVPVSWPNIKPLE